MADVPFSEVAELPYNPPTEILAYGESPSQVIEYWSSDEESPLIVLIHGGCWLNAYGQDHIRPLASALADQNIAVASVEYRRIGDAGGGWPGTFDDVSLALETAARLPHAGVFTLGHSAGGHLALWLGARDPETVSGVIGLAAISDLASYAAGDSPCEQATIELLGGPPDIHPDRYQQASPHMMDINTRVLLLHGDADRIVPLQQSEQYVKRKQGTGQRVEVTNKTLEGKGHFDLIDPRQAVVQAITQQLNFWLTH